MFGLNRKEFWLTEIESIQLIELSDGQGGGDPNLYLKMADGSRIKIFSGQLFTRNDRSRTITQKIIREFLRDTHDGVVTSEAPAKPPGVSIHRRITGILSRSNRNRLLQSSGSSHDLAGIEMQLLSKEGAVNSNHDDASANQIGNTNMLDDSDIL